MSEDFEKQFRRIVRILSCIGIAFFLIWRAYVYADSDMAASILPLIMCTVTSVLMLAIASFSLGKVEDQGPS